MRGMKKMNSKIVIKKIINLRVMKKMRGMKKMNSKIVIKIISIFCAVAMSASPMGGSINVFATGSSTSASNTTNRKTNSQLNLTSNQLVNMCRFTLEKEIEKLNLELGYKVDKTALNANRHTDELSKMIEESNEKIEQVSNNLKNNEYFEALKTKILNKEINSDKFFQEINNRRGMHPRFKAAMTIALDNWMANNNITHNTSICNSIYFVDEKNGGIVWPDNAGYRGNARVNYLNKLVVGKEIDRFGSEYGTYVCPVNSSKIYQFNERSLPHKENLNTFHRYKIIKDFSKLKEVVSDLKLSNILTLEKNAMDKYYEINKIADIPEIKAFNYYLLQKLTKNRESVASRGKNRREKDVIINKCKELEQILQKIDDEFNKVHRMTSDVSYRKMIEKLSDQEKLGYISLTKISNINNIEAGEIASAFKKQGRGTQIVLPLSVSLLKTLGFLTDVVN